MRCAGWGGRRCGAQGDDQARQATWERDAGQGEEVEDVVRRVRRSKMWYTGRGGRRCGTQGEEVEDAVRRARRLKMWYAG